MILARKGRKQLVEWPKRPRVSFHPTLGRRSTWLSRCGQWKIERFAGGSGEYIVLMAYGLADDPDFRPVATRGNLHAAKRRAENLARLTFNRKGATNGRCANSR